MILDPELFRTLARRAEEAQRALLEDAKTEFERQMQAVRRYLQEGDTRRARAELQWLVDNIGVEQYVNEAKAELVQLK